MGGRIVAAEAAVSFPVDTQVQDFGRPRAAGLHRLAHVGARIEYRRQDHRDVRIGVAATGDIGRPQVVGGSGFRL